MVRRKKTARLSCVAQWNPMMERPDDSSERDAEARLESWEVAECEAEEDEFEAALAAVREAENTDNDDRAMIEEHRAVEYSIAKKLEEDISHAFNYA